MFCVSVSPSTHGHSVFACHCHLFPLQKNWPVLTQQQFGEISDESLKFRLLYSMSITFRLSWQQLAYLHLIRCFRHTSLWWKNDFSRLFHAVPILHYQFYCSPGINVCFILAFLLLLLLFSPGLGDKGRDKLLKVHKKSLSYVCQILYEPCDQGPSLF